MQEQDCLLSAVHPLRSQVAHSGEYPRTPCASVLTVGVGTSKHEYWGPAVRYLDRSYSGCLDDSSCQCRVRLSVSTPLYLILAIKRLYSLRHNDMTRNNVFIPLIHKQAER